VGKMKNAYNILVRNSQGKSPPLGRHNLKIMGVSQNWSYRSQDGDWTGYK
jgi:hypothetical protein